MPICRLAGINVGCGAGTDRSTVDIWSLEPADVLLARQLHSQFPEIGARDLCHFASCRRRGVNKIRTFDRGLSVIAERYL
jgi:predicted nucleic acid-binding protein